MKILITGASGFLGRYVARFFADQGCLVTGIGRGAWPAENDSHVWGLTKWMQANVTVDSLLSVCKEPDAIIHCAGSGSVANSFADPLADYQMTVETTAHVLEYIRKYSPQSILVYPSSAAVYGVSEEFPIREDSVLHPVSPYGVNKKIAEDLCYSYGRIFGLKSAIVRFFSLYGPELRKQLLWDACTKIMNGRLLFYGTGMETRDWLHVKDAARLLSIAVQHAAQECPIVNGGSGNETTVRDVIMKLTASLGTQQAPDFNLQQKTGDPIHYQADITTVTSWGWAPQITLDAGIAEYTDWFRDVT